MTTAKKKAEELAIKVWHLHLTVQNLTDTLLPLLEEIEAARAYTDSLQANSSTGEIGLHIGFKQAYDKIRARNEKGE